MYTNSSDIQFENGNFHPNINTIFRATFTMKHKETMIAILIRISCNICKCLTGEQTSGNQFVALPKKKKILFTAPLDTPNFSTSLLRRAPVTLTSAKSVVQLQPG